MIYGRRLSLGQTASAEGIHPSSIEDQTSMCRKHAEARGWLVTADYADAAKTGRMANRPKYIRIRYGVAEKVLDVVVVDAAVRKMLQAALCR